MDLLIGLFWIGVVLAVAMFVFNFVLGALFLIIGVVVAGISTVWGWVFGNDN